MNEESHVNIVFWPPDWTKTLVTFHGCKITEFENWFSDLYKSGAKLSTKDIEKEKNKIRKLVVEKYKNKEIVREQLPF